MNIKRLATAVLLLTACGLAGTARSQDDSDNTTARPARKFPILEGIDNFGRNLFGMNSRDEPPPRKPTPPPANPPSYQPWATPGTQRSTPAVGPVAPNAPRTGALQMPPTADEAGAARLQPTYRDYAGDRNTNLSSPLPRSEVPSNTVPLSSGAATSVPRPLHERMSSFRISAFDHDGAEPSPERPATTAGASAGAASPLPAAVESPLDTIPTPARRPIVTPRPEIASPLAESPAPGSADPQAEHVATRPAMVAEAGRPRPDQRGANVLVARKSPMISVETLGPRRITVGKEAVYQLQVTNGGEVAAEDVVVSVTLPAWADVVGHESSAGAAQVGSLPDGSRPLAWKVGQLGPGARERMALRLVPRENRPFDLGVRWDCKPATAEAVIEVQEPKLALHLEGPRDVLYGRKELYALKLANTGNGDAENVTITLLPVGTGDNQPASHRLGLLAAGAEKTIEVELTARQTGELLIQVEARGDNNVHGELAEKILVRRASLQLDLQGPQVQYVNAVAAYRVRVVNPGNAPAHNVRLAATLPPGGKYLAGIEGAKVEANGNRVLWLVDTVAPNAEQIFTLKCQLTAAGPCRLETVCTADDELTASAAATTRVDAVADLTMQVKDPSGPVAVGDEAVYEVRIRNRGTKAAEGVEVMVFFSNGIEPMAVEGGGHKIQSGQVVFDPITAIAAGAEVTLKIRAKADLAGAHIFRAEVHCKPLGTRLVSEETTHFYQDATGAAAPPLTAAEPPRPLGTLTPLPPVDHAGPPGPFAPPPGPALNPLKR